MKSSNYNHRQRLAAMFIVLCSYAINAQALCYGRQQPSVQQEFASSTFVLTGTVTKSQEISAPDDPQGVAATQYQIEINQLFKGKVPAAGQSPASISIHAENTSSRIVLETGQQYLLFVRSDAEYHYVDACGHSGLSAKRQAVLQELRQYTNQ